ncbi:MAG: AMP-binding protein [Comamonadaceae bacterium]|nr:AMP-binding protein [Comamonadaceae bacterium]
MSNIGSYDERVKNFSWSIAEKELGYKPGDVINIGWYCTDRICQQGKGDKVALYWEGFTGAEKTYTYNDIRLASNTIAAFLRGLGIQPEERVCLFMDRVPELYLGFLGILKTGAIAQPLFSAFGDESLLVRLSNAETSAVITQKKHAPKVRKILDKLPHLRHIIVVDHDGIAPLRDREVAFSLEKSAPVEHFDVHPTKAESPSVLHYTSGTTGHAQGRQARPLLADLPVPHGQVGPRPPRRRHLLVYGRSRLGHGHLVRHHRAVRPGRHPVRPRRRLLGRGLVQVDREAQGDDVVLGPDGHPLAHEGRRRDHQEVRPVVPPPPGQRRRTAELRGGRLVPEGLRQALLRHLLADRDRLHRHRQLPGHGGPAGLDGQALPRHHRDRPRPGQERALRRPTARSAWSPSSSTGPRGCGPTGTTKRPSRRSSATAGTSPVTGPSSTPTATSGSPAATTTSSTRPATWSARSRSNRPCSSIRPWPNRPSCRKPDPINLEVVKAFVTLKPGFTASKDLDLEIMNFIRKKLSPLAMPQEIEFIPTLPKTRSGKIMRRLLHAKEWGEEIGDTSTLEND